MATEKRPRARSTTNYDAAGRPTQLIDPLGRITTFGYDRAGAVELRVDAHGNRTTYTMDALGRVVGRLYPNGSRATFAFDSVGNRVQMSDSTGDYTYAYDPANRLVASMWPGRQKPQHKYTTRRGNARR